MTRSAIAPRIGATLGLLAVLLSAEPLSARGPRMSEAEKRNFEQQQVSQAQQACKNSDYKAFFGLMVQSEAVRRHFTAEKVEYAEVDARGAGRSTFILREAYDRFPIRMVDFQWRSARPLRPGDTDEHVITVMTRSSTNHVAIEWTRVHYRAPFKGEESLGTPYDLDGKRYNAERPGHGKLLLLPVGDCWQLSADIRRTAR